MYNQYIPNDWVYERLYDEPPPSEEDIPPKEEKQKKDAGFAGILKKFKLDKILEKFDSSDILLLLILLFLLWEGDNKEIVMLLGLVLFLNL